MSALPVLVTPTDPPTQGVKVLGYELHVGPSHMTSAKIVLVCMGWGGIHALHGVPERHWSPVRPAIPVGPSPVAEVLLKPAQGPVYARDITLLNPDGSEWTP